MFHSKTIPPLGEPFKLGLVLKAEAPPGAAGDDWRRYEITQGKHNTIVGYRRGSLRDVTVAIEEMVVRLNERRLGRSGRVHLTLTQKKAR